MIIGPSRSGKTSLARILEGTELPRRRTAEPIYGQYTLECPGAYLENPGMYMHLIALAQDACCIVLMIGADTVRDPYPPKLAGVFSLPVIGAVSKLDLVPEKRESCVRILRSAGVDGPVFYLDGPESEGAKQLKEYVFQLRSEECIP